MRNSFFPAILLTISLGCVGYMPGAAVGGLGTLYHHTEWDSETGSKTWETRVYRSWGTSRANTYVDTEFEQIGIEGEGMSDNTQRTLGDDLGVMIADKALCAIPAVAASCLFDDDPAGVFTGDSTERAAAVERLQDLLAPNEEVVH